jgi:cholesterol oxidase
VGSDRGEPGCISCGNCNIGCGHNAKNKLTTNYLALAGKLGAQVHELHEVYDLIPLDGGGSRSTHATPAGSSEASISTVTRTPPSR